MVEMDIRVRAADLYDYNLKHTYSKLSGILGTLVGAFGIFYGAMIQYWILVIFGVIVLFYNPWTLWLRSAQAAQNPVFKNPLHYKLDDEGLTISQGDVTTTQPWDEMYKAISTSRSIILYTTPINATIFPKKQMQDLTPLLIREISTHMDPAKVKIKE